MEWHEEKRALEHVEYSWNEIRDTSKKILTASIGIRTLDRSRINPCSSQLIKRSALKVADHEVLS